MEMGSEQRKLDFAQTASIDKVALNNKVIQMRPVIRRAKLYVINGLSKKIKKLKSKKGNEIEKEKNQSKAGRMLEEIKAIQTLQPDYVSKFALGATVKFEEVIAKPSTTMELRALARLSGQKFVQSLVTQFRTDHSDWADLTAYLMTKHTSREFRKKKTKEKMKKVEQKVKASETLIHTYLGGKLTGEDIGETITASGRQSTTDVTTSVKGKQGKAISTLNNNTATSGTVVHGDNGNDRMKDQSSLKDRKNQKKIDQSSVSALNKHNSDDDDDNDDDDSDNDDDNSDDNGTDYNSEESSDDEETVMKQDLNKNKNTNKGMPKTLKGSLEKESNTDDDNDEDDSDDEDEGGGGGLGEALRHLKEIKNSRESSKQETTHIISVKNTENVRSKQSNIIEKMDVTKENKADPYDSDDSESNVSESEDEMGGTNPTVAETDDDDDDSNGNDVADEDDSESNHDAVDDDNDDSDNSDDEGSPGDESDSDSNDDDNSDENIQETLEKNTKLLKVNKETNKGKDKKPISGKEKPNVFKAMEKVQGEMIIKKFHVDKSEQDDILDTDKTNIPQIILAKDETRKLKKHKKKDAFFDCSDSDADSDDNVNDDGDHQIDEENEALNEGGEAHGQSSSSSAQLGMNAFTTTFVGSLSSEKMMDYTGKEFRTNQEWKKMRQDRRAEKTGAFSERGGRGKFEDRGGRGGFPSRGRGFRGQDRGFSHSNRGHLKGPSYRDNDTEYSPQGHMGRGRGGSGRGRGHIQSDRGQGQRSNWGQSHGDHKTSNASGGGQSGKVHPSWEASKKRKQQMGQIQAFAGKKIKFDD